MTIAEKVPTLSDEALATLRLNAKRLAKSGNDRDKVAALDLLPVLDLEMQGRRASRLSVDAPQSGSGAGSEGYQSLGPGIATPPKRSSAGRRQTAVGALEGAAGVARKAPKAKSKKAKSVPAGV